MTPNWIRAGLFGVAVLTGAMMANIFVLQTHVGSQRGAGVTAGPDGPEIARSWSHQMASRATGAIEPAGAVQQTDGAELTRAVQRELKAKGYDTGGVDGIPGLVTRAAIMAYESDRGLPLTGEPGQALLQNIVLGTDAGQGASRGEPGPQAQAVIKAVQRSLAALGFAPGPVSGRLGEETARAIRKFEAAQGMRESGRISGPLIARLTRAGGPLQAANGP